MIKKFGLFLLIFSVLVVGVIYYFGQRALNQRIPEGLSNYSFVISKGESLTSILNRFQDAGFITSPQVVKLFLQLKPQIAQNIQAGGYEIKPNEKLLNVLKSLRDGKVQRPLTFIEGWRREQYAGYLSAQVSSEFAGEFLVLTEFDEGILFPDTYYVDDNTKPEDLITRMKDNFQRKISEVMAGYRGILEQRDIVIMASLIEREVVDPIDRGIVAGILMNRYNAGMQLGIDATVQYAVASENALVVGMQNAINNKEFLWWHKEITQGDLEVDSLYNTRKYAGLPPGPICNPGKLSLQAVITPVVTDYNYYLTDADGITRYAVTLDEHNQNIAQFGVR